jgi:hypothetical protein
MQQELECSRIVENPNALEPKSGENLERESLEGERNRLDLGAQMGAFFFSLQLCNGKASCWKTERQR